MIARYPIPVQRQRCDEIHPAKVLTRGCACFGSRGLRNPPLYQTMMAHFTEDLMIDETT